MWINCETLFLWPWFFSCLLIVITFCSCASSVPSELTTTITTTTTTTNASVMIVSLNGSVEAPRRIIFEGELDEEQPSDDRRAVKPNRLDGLNEADAESIEILDLPTAEAFECGLNRFENESPLTERIVGGTESHHGEFPWQVSIRLTHPQAGKLGHWCGGVLIHPQWVLTASHCIINPVFSLLDPIYWQVRVGEHSLRHAETSEQTFPVERLFHVKQYKGYDNDLALLKLVDPVELNEFVRPICLPPHRQFDFRLGTSGDECFATGWGKIDHNKRGSDVLQKVKVRVFENEDCHRVYYARFKIAIKAWHLCAGNKSGGIGTCHGDSGGPLQCKLNGRWYLAGLTSFGSGCAKPGFPDVYSKITHFMPWIQEKMEQTTRIV